MPAGKNASMNELVFPTTCSCSWLAAAWALALASSFWRSVVISAPIAWR